MQPATSEWLHFQKTFVFSNVIKKTGNNKINIRN